MRSRKAELQSFTQELERQALEWQRVVDALSRIEPSTRFLLATSVLEELEAVWARPPCGAVSSGLRA